MAITLRPVRSLADIDENLKRLAQALSNITGDQIAAGSIGDVASSTEYMPRAGGAFTGGISAPSVSINGKTPATTDQLPATAAASADAAASAVAVAAADAAAAPAGGTGAAAGAWDTAANRDLAIDAINATVTLANELKADVNTLVANLNAVVTSLNDLKAKLRTAGVLSA